MKKRMFVIVMSLLVASGYTSSWPSLSTTQEFWVNGLKVILKPNTANQIISVQLYLRGGSLNLDDATQGIEPLIFRSAVRGSDNYAKERLNATLDRTAATITSRSNRDFTMVSLRCVARYFDELWDVFADVIMHPSFAPEEVELVRQNRLVAIRQRQDHPDSLVREVARGLFYEAHPYRLNPNGVEASVANISIEQMRGHLGNILQTSNLLLVVVGSVGKEDLVKKVEATFGTLPAGTHEPVYPSRVSHRSANLKVVERELPTNYILGYVGAPNLRDPDFYAMTVAMDILGERVMEEVRTKRSLSYAPDAFFSGSLSSRAGIYVTAVDPDTTIKVMLNEVRRLQTEPVSVRDVRDRIAIYLTDYFLRNETNARQGRFLADFELAGVGWQESERFVDNVREVTVEDVQRVADQYLHNIQFGVLGDPTRIDRELFTSM